MLEEENNTKKDEVKTSEGRKQNVKNSRAIPKSIITFLFLFFLLNLFTAGTFAISLFNIIASQ